MESDFWRPSTPQRGAGSKAGTTNHLLMGQYSSQTLIHRHHLTLESSSITMNVMLCALSNSGLIMEIPIQLSLLMDI